MKKYFAKWIPVEGEVKEGDIAMYQSKTSNTFTFIGKLVHKPSSEVGNRNEGYYLISENDFLGIGYPRELQKVKLYICSRDIEVGDTLKAGKVMNMELFVKLTNNKITYHVIEQRGPSKGYCSPIAYNPESYPEAVKVIGVVSERAIWVKEGMEFEENEILREPIFDFDREDENELIGFWVKILCSNCQSLR